MQRRVPAVLRRPTLPPASMAPGYPGPGNL